MYRKLVNFLVILLLAVCALIAIIFYQLINKPAPKYFATTVDGKILPLSTLSAPILSPSELLQWVERAAVEAYTYNFVDYKDALNQLQNEFTDDGWQQYEAAMQRSKAVDTVVAKKLMVSAVTTGVPVIVNQAVVNGRYTWKVQMPLLVTYQSPNEQIQQPVIVTIIVSRVPTVDNPRGIAIASFRSTVTSRV